MNELVSAWSALPNLHPALVHFPIALAMTALLIDGTSLLLRKRRAWGPATAMLYVLAAVGSVATYLSGRQAAGSVGQLAPAAEAVLAEHADLGLLTMVTLCLAAALRVVGASFTTRRVAAPAATVAMLLMAVASGLVVATADHGGALVYQHGVAVSRPAESTSPGRPVPTPASGPEQLHRSEVGSLRWRPSGGQEASLDSVLRPARGAPADAVTISRSTASGDDGVRVDVYGSTVVCLPGTYDDVVLTAAVDLGGYEGVLGLGHHIRSVGDGMFFTVSSGGEAKIVRRSDGESSIMDRGSVSWPEGLVTLRTSVAGRHLKGQVGDEIVVHGHGPSGEPGSVGLLLDGIGEVRIVEVRVEPVEAHDENS